MSGPLPYGAMSRAAQPSATTVRAAFAAGPPTSSRWLSATIFSLRPGVWSTTWIRSAVTTPPQTTTGTPDAGGCGEPAAGRAAITLP